MLLFPRKPKYTKSFANKKIVSSNQKTVNKLKFSKLGLISKQAGFIGNFQIEAIRIFLRRLLNLRRFFCEYDHQLAAVKLAAEFHWSGRQIWTSWWGS